MDKVKMDDAELDAVIGGSVIPYQIQPGDTLEAVARKFNVSMDQLMKWNSIQDPNILMVGQQLKIKF